MDKKGLLVILSGPSGAGKGTVVKEIMKNEDYCLSTSATTRAPRQGEVDGVHYFFKSHEEFEKLIEDKKMLEYASFCGEYYGTPLEYVLNKLDEGKNVILEIEVQGALQVKEKYPDAVLIFLSPDNIFELKNRLVNRGTETEEKINMRIERAKEEIMLIDKYDYIVINSVVEDAVNDINKIVESEKNKAFRNLYLKETFFKGDE